MTTNAIPASVRRFAADAGAQVEASHPQFSTVSLGNVRLVAFHEDGKRLSRCYVYRNDNCIFSDGSLRLASATFLRAVA